MNEKHHIIDTRKTNRLEFFYDVQICKSPTGYSLTIFVTSPLPKALISFDTEHKCSIDQLGR